MVDVEKDIEWKGKIYYNIPEYADMEHIKTVLSDTKIELTELVKTTIKHLISRKCTIKQIVTLKIETFKTSYSLEEFKI